MNNNLRPLKPSDINFENPAQPVLLGKDEVALIVFDLACASKIFSSEQSAKSFLDGAMEESLLACGLIGSEEAILAEKKKYDNNPKYEVHIIRSADYQPAMRPLTFGDFEDNCIKLGCDEAAIIVIDLGKAALSKKYPKADINPFVSAYVGDPAAILKEKAKYDNNPQYNVSYFPPAN